MITLRRADQRRHNRRRRQEAWLTFSASDHDDPLADGFGALRMLNEDCLPPGARLGNPHHDAEIVTYVREGALAYEDSTGRSAIIQAGEFRYVSTRQWGRQTETNASRTAWTHVFQIWVRPSELGLEPSDEQKRFSSADRRGVLCVVASPDARRGSLRIHQDALMYSAMLDPGQHVVHELVQGRSAWLHVVRGDATLGDIVLTTGDGVGVTAERAVSLTARTGTELLLLDIRDPPPRSSHNGQKKDRTSAVEADGEARLRSCHQHLLNGLLEGAGKQQGAAEVDRSILYRTPGASSDLAHELPIHNRSSTAPGWNVSSKI